jgi:hypothetical protein
MQENMKNEQCWWNNTGPMGWDVQDERYLATCERGEKMDAQTPMPFQGDGRSDTPSFAWTFLWREVYSCLYGAYTPGGLRSWGYVFWDESRLKSMGAIEVLEREMKDWWDPREEDEEGNTTPYSWARQP